MSSSRSRSASPRPLLTKDKLPKDTATATGADQLRAHLSKFLGEIEKQFIDKANNMFWGPWRGPKYPDELLALRYHCKDILAEQGIDRASNGSRKPAPLKDVRDQCIQDEFFSSLVTLRMMQLNLAGDDKFSTSWAKSMLRSNKRLAELIFKNKVGIAGWKTKLLSDKEKVCSACRSLDHSKQLELISMGDQVTVLPCPQDRLIHTRCVGEWTRDFKHCPECPDMGEYIL